MGVGAVKDIYKGILSNNGSYPAYNPIGPHRTVLPEQQT